MTPLKIVDRAGHPIGYEYEVKVTRGYFDGQALAAIKDWLADHKIDAGFHRGYGTIGFDREADRTFFLLRWANRHSA